MHSSTRYMAVAALIVVAGGAVAQTSGGLEAAARPPQQLRVMDAAQTSTDVIPTYLLADLSSQGIALDPSSSRLLHSEARDGGIWVARKTDKGDGQPICMVNLIGADPSHFDGQTPSWAAASVCASEGEFADGRLASRVTNGQGRTIAAAVLPDEVALAAQASVRSPIVSVRGNLVLVTDVVRARSKEGRVSFGVKGRNVMIDFSSLLAGPPDIG